MKKLYIYLSFSNEQVDFICEKMASTLPSQKFLGFWGKIGFNKEECVKAISSAVNYFLETDKEEIHFGVDEADLSDVLESVNTQNVDIIKIYHED